MPLQIAPGMMVHVADNEQPNHPAPTDPEQQRQFEQFQQFQQFLKFQEAQGQLPPAAPPKPVPVWKKILRSKMFRKLVFLAIVIAGLIWAYDYYFGPEPDDSTVHGGAGPGTPDQQQHVENPNAGMTTLYGFVAAGNKDACKLFEPAAAKQFADDFRVGDCQAVVTQFAGKVDANPPVPRVKWTGLQVVTVSSCTDLRPKEGTEPLGKFTFTKKRDGWLISGHTSEPCPAATTPPTTTSR